MTLTDFQTHVVTDLDTTQLSRLNANLSATKERLYATARESGGTAYQNIMGLPLPPSLEYKSWDYREEADGAPSDTTVVRASNAYQTNAVGIIESVASNVLRHEYAPVSGEYLGWLIENSSTNLFTYSEELDNAAWVKTASTVTANDIVSPDGTTTMDKIVATAATSEHYLSQSISVTNGLAYTFSAFVKKSEYDTFRVGRSGGVFSVFDIVNGTVLSDVNVDNSGIKDVGGGIYRVFITYTAAATTSYAHYLQLTDNSGTASFLGDGTSGTHVWGIKIEQGVCASSYVKTVAATATRAADNLSVLASAFPYNQSEGTFYCEFSLESVDETTTIIEAHDGTSNNRLVIQQESGTLKAYSIVGGVTQAELNLGSVSIDTYYAVSFSYNTNSFIACLDGGTPVTDVSGTVPTITTINIGSRNSGVSCLDGTIRQTVYFPREITSSSHQIITS